MADVKSRRWREPLSDAERLLGKRYYDLDQRRTILQSVQLKSDVDPDRLLDRIEWWVHAYLLPLAAIAHERRTPDQTRREFRSLATRVRKYQTDKAAPQPDATCRRRLNRGRAALEMKLKRIRDDIDLRNDLLGAAARIADLEGELPDLSSECDLAGTVIWPLEEQIDLALGSIAGAAWLARVADEAIARIEFDLRPAGNRGNELAEALERALVTIYAQAAARARDPVYDEVHAGGHAGEMLVFLRSCLQPIGDDRLPEALYKAICRVFPTPPAPRGQLWGRPPKG
jgi:hypothetical protein